MEPSTELVHRAEEFRLLLLLLLSPAVAAAAAVVVIRFVRALGRMLSPKAAAAAAVKIRMRSLPTRTFTSRRADLPTGGGAVPPAGACV